MKKVFIMTASLGMLFLAGCQNTTTIPSTDTTQTGLEVTGTLDTITGSITQSFEDCVNHGFPVMESYPRKCNDGTTIYTEEITGSLQQESTGEILTGEQHNSTEEITGSNQQESTGTNLSILQQRLRAMMQRRSQETQGTPSPMPTTSSGTTSTPQTATPTTSTSSNDKVTEQDIANLEKIIDEITKKK